MARFQKDSFWALQRPVFDPASRQCAQVLIDYVSDNSKPDQFPGQTPGEFFERANSPPPGTKKVRNPNPWGKKIPDPHPREYYFQKSSTKTTKHKIEIMKNSTEMLICLEILKQ